MAKTSVSPKGPRTKILLPPRVKPASVYIGLRLSHLTTNCSVPGRQDRGLPLRWSPTQLRQPLHDVDRRPADPPEDPRPCHPAHDLARRPPGPGPRPRSHGRVRLWHTV